MELANLRARLAVALVRHGLLPHVPEPDRPRVIDDMLAAVFRPLISNWSWPGIVEDIEAAEVHVDEYRRPLLQMARLLAAMEIAIMGPDFDSLRLHE